MSARPLAVFFAKKPEAGLVKTRLCPPLDPVAAAELYHRMLLDLFRRFGRRRFGEGHDYHLGVAMWPSSGREYFERNTPAGTHFFVQRGEGLARRMSNFFDDAFAEGWGPVIVMGSDIPLLSVDRVQEALDALQGTNELVLGPDGGGGYYLIGLRQATPELFERIPMSTPSTFQETLDRARQLQLRTAFLPVEEDLDHPEDLLRLVGTIAKRSTTRAEIPELVSFLRQLGYLTEIPTRL